MILTKKKLTVHIVNAFVDGEPGGNPAGIVLDADNLTQTEKQIIASKVGLSETAFVSASKIADIKLEFYTPTRQILHCGHATIGTFSLLAQQNKITSSHSSKETIEGRREVFIREGIAFMEQLAPRYTQLSETPVTSDDVLSSLRITLDSLIKGKSPLIVNTGVNCLVVPLIDENTVAKINPDLTTVEEISRKLDLVEFYLFSMQTKKPDSSAGTRMFAPLYGIAEESATGMAAGSLGCYLYDFMDVKKKYYRN